MALLAAAADDDDDDRETDETRPRLRAIPTTSSRIQVVPGTTNNRMYPFPPTMPVLVQLGQAARNYYKDEGVLPSQMQLEEGSYDEVAPFLVPYEKSLCYWLDGNNPILVSIYRVLRPHQVKCIGRTTGAMDKLLAEQREQHAV